MPLDCSKVTSHTKPLCRWWMVLYNDV